RCGGHRIAVENARNDRVGAAVQEKVSDRLADRAELPEPAKDALVLGKTLDARLAVYRAFQRPPDKGGNRSGDPGNGPNAARDLLDINARVGQRYRHGSLRSER